MRLCIEVRRLEDELEHQRQYSELLEARCNELEDTVEAQHHEFAEGLRQKQIYEATLLAMFHEAASPEGKGESKNESKGNNAKEGASDTVAEASGAEVKHDDGPRLKCLSTFSLL